MGPLPLVSFCAPHSSVAWLLLHQSVPSACSCLILTTHLPFPSCCSQVADFEFWKKHRSSSRYWRHVKGMLDSRTLSWVAGPLSYVMLLTTGVCLYYTLAEVRCKLRKTNLRSSLCIRGMCGG